MSETKHGVWWQRKEERVQPAPLKFKADGRCLLMRPGGLPAVKDCRACPACGTKLIELTRGASCAAVELSPREVLTNEAAYDRLVTRSRELLASVDSIAAEEAAMLEIEAEERRVAEEKRREKDRADTELSWFAACQAWELSRAEGPPPDRARFGLDTLTMWVRGHGVVNRAAYEAEQKAANDYQVMALEMGLPSR